MIENQKFTEAVELLKAVREYGQGYDEKGNFAEFTEEGYAEVADPFDEALVKVGYVLEDIEEGPTFNAHLIIGYGKYDSNKDVDRGGPAGG